MMRVSAVILLVALIAIAIANAEIGGKRTLVLLDGDDIKQTHSIFFKSLADRGYQLNYVQASEQVKLQKYGDYFYDNLIVFAPTSDDITVSSTDIINFIDAGNNVLLAGANVVSDTIRDVASEIGMEIEDDKTNVFDHYNFDKSESQHNLIVGDRFINDSPIILKDKKAPVLFKGIGHAIRNNPLNYAILTAASTAYSAKLSTGASTKLYGTSVGLVSSLQARNNARVTFSGSLDLFSDKYIQSTINCDCLHNGQKAGNGDFVNNLVSWTFQERGILRYSNLVIAKGNDTNPAILTIKDNITYSIKVEEFVNGKWTPYVGTLELQIIMLDPYIRTFIKGNKDGVYSADIQLPDVYGVFTFEATVHRPGYGNLQSIVRHPIRPFRHDSYERFIPSAFPYYAAAFSMISGVFVFSIVFLLHKDSK